MRKRGRRRDRHPTRRVTWTLADPSLDPARFIVNTAQRSRALFFAAVWLGYYVALQWSVVRFKVPIVVVLTLSALLLAWWQVRRYPVRLTPTAVVLMLGGSALATLLVPLFSYLRGPGLTAATALLVVVPIVLAGLLWPGRAGMSRLAAVIATLGFLTVGAIAIRTDPAPRIDVWVTLQQASDALARGVNFYEVTWSGSPGVADAFTYLPWTAVLLAPGRWLAGDVRWALLVWTVVAAIGVWALAAGRGRPGVHWPHHQSARGVDGALDTASEPGGDLGAGGKPRIGEVVEARGVLDIGDSAALVQPEAGGDPAAAGQTQPVGDPAGLGTPQPTGGPVSVSTSQPGGDATSPSDPPTSGQPRPGGGRWHPPGPSWMAASAIALLLFAPGTLTQVDQSWSEPLLFAGLVWWAVLVDRGRAWWAVIPLALACASKQHLALLLPVLLVWRPFGIWRTLSTGALTAVLIAPWFLASPSDFVRDTVTLLISFHAILFANTLYLLALNVVGVELPFWITGLVVVGSLTAVVAAVHRRQPDVGELLRWLALLLLVANLVNKQAFYNQYWLVGALVVASLVAPRMTTSPSSPACDLAAAPAGIVRPPP